MRLPLIVAAFVIVLLRAIAAPLPVDAGEAPVAGKAFYQAVAQLIDRSVTVFIAHEPVRMILVVKDRQRLLVVEHDGVRPRVLAEYVCSTGENDGNKQVRGDERTPEGIYFITKVYTDSKLTVFGHRAFHLDYPNYFDQEAKRGGDGIFIHGTNRELRPRGTNGCVTLCNADLEKLAGYLARDEVPVIIVPRLTVPAPAVSDADSLIGPVKALLLPNGVERERMDFDTLYLIRACAQTVAVAEFSDSATAEQQSRQGYSRSYMEFSPASGWITTQWVWHPPNTSMQTAQVAEPVAHRIIAY